MANLVKSVEYIEVSFAGTDLLKSINLTKNQDYRNCVPFVTSHSTGTYFDSKLIDTYFSGTYLAGIINFDRSTQRANTVTVRCYVVEFDPTEVKVQQGTFNIDSPTTTHTVTLPTTLANIDRAGMVFAWKANDTTLGYNTMVVRGRVVSTTSIDFYRATSTAYCNGHWFLFEDLKTNFRVTHRNNFFSTISDTLTIDNGRCIDLLRSFVIGSYATNYTADQPASGIVNITLQSHGAVTCERTTATNTVYWSCQIVEFMDTSKIYTPFDHYACSFSSTTLTRTVGNDPNKVPFVCNSSTASIVCCMTQGIARHTSTASAANGELFVSTKLNSNNAIDYEKSVASYLIYPSYTLAVEWNGISVSLGTNDSIITEGTGLDQSFVKSVENFRFTLEDFFGAKVLTKDQNWQNCAVFASNRSTSGTSLTEHLTNVYIVSPGVVCFKRWSETGQTYIDVSVVEFWPSQVKVQHKNIYTQKNNTTLVSIDEVNNINKCFLLSKSFSVLLSNFPTYLFNKVKFNNENSIEIYKHNNIYPSDTAFFVVEDVGNNFETVHFENNFTGASQKVHDDTFRWEPNATFPIVSYASADTVGWASRHTLQVNYNYEFNPINFIKQDPTYYTIYCSLSLIKFLDDKIHVQLLERNFGTTSTFTSTYNNNFSDAITCFNVSQQSLMQSAIASTNGTLDALGTIRVIDYETKTYEQTKTGSSYASYGSFAIIDWIGYRIDDNDNKLIPTKSIVNSIQKFDYFDTDSIREMYLSKGQNIDQCVPFVSSSVHSTDSLYTRLYKSIYRYKNPDMFRARSAISETGNAYNTFSIVEFSKDIKIQYGEGYFQTTTKSFTIENVNLSRAFLLFYAYSDAVVVGLQSISVCGHFIDSTTIEFMRAVANETVYVSWYIIECPDSDDYWKVQHLYSTTKGTTVTVYADLNYVVDTYRTMYIGSWNSTSNDAHASRSLYKMMHTLDNKIAFTKVDLSYHSMNNLNVEVVEFSKNLNNKGFMSLFGESILNTTTVSTDIPLKHTTDLDRSIVICGNNLGGGNCSATTTVAHREAFHHYKFKDASTVTATKTGGASYNTSSFFYVYQFPEYNKYYIEATVDELNIPVARTVMAYRTLTGELVDVTTSDSGTGYYLIETPYPDEHHVVCLDDAGGYEYNHLIYGKVYPAVISGSFAYNEGLVTVTSGMDIGVPLCYV